MMKISKLDGAVGAVVLEASKEPKTLAQLSIDRVTQAILVTGSSN